MKFSRHMIDNISLIKKDGERIDNIKASVQSKKIFIMQSDILIEIGDLIQRKMSNGGEETYEVIDPVFYEKSHGIPAHYQIKHRKLGLPEAKKAVQNITYNQNIHIGGNNNGMAISGNQNTIINSEFEKKFTQLIQTIRKTNIEDKNQIIQNLNENKNNKIELQKYLGILLSRSAEITTLAPVIGSLLGVL